MLTSTKNLSPELFTNPVPAAFPDAVEDWKARKGQCAVPFDIIILTQTPQESEMDLLLDYGAEPVASYAQNARIYRLKDNRFCILACSDSVIANAPGDVTFWNWWARGPMPSFSDLTEKTAIMHKLAELELARKVA
jgi:hypothetical protein